MITFKQFLSEARMAPLYHGTGPFNIQDIIRTNELAAKTVHEHAKVFNGNKNKQHRYAPNVDSKVRGVSLSRSAKTARHFGPFIFELDQQKLSHNHRITPVNYWNSEAADESGDFMDAARNLNSKANFETGNEYEEFVTGPIKNLERYLIKLWVPQSFKASAANSYISNYPSNKIGYYSDVNEITKNKN